MKKNTIPALFLTTFDISLNAKEGNMVIQAILEFKAVSIILKDCRLILASYNTGSQGCLQKQHASSWYQKNNCLSLPKELNLRIDFPSLGFFVNIDLLKAWFWVLLPEK